MCLIKVLYHIVRLYLNVFNLIDMLCLNVFHQGTVPYSHVILKCVNQGDVPYNHVMLKCV